MTEEQKEILKQANIPITWWPYCTIKDGVIYTPSMETLYENELVSEEEYQYWLSQGQIDNCSVKQQKVQQSKELLATWLASNPLVSSVHGGTEASYTVTEEKQQQLTQIITLSQLAAQTGQAFSPTWNTTGGACEEWTIEELITLSFQISQYVLPRVKKQQLYELQINACETADQVEAITIEYETIV